MNTKHLLYKEKLKVQRELLELEDIKASQNWIKLDKPYKHGYYKSYDLRDDIKNRDDAWVFHECIKLVGGRVWWKNKSFRKKLKKGKFEYIFAGFGNIPEKTYAALHPTVKKYFKELSPWDRNWHPIHKHYCCIAPHYYFVDIIKPYWITKYKEFDSVIEGQIDIKRKELYWSDKFIELSGDRRGISSYAKCHNKSDRAHTRQTIHRNIVNGGEDFDNHEYRYKHRHSAIWEAW